jgi:hypothetical protein
MDANIFSCKLHRSKNTKSEILTNPVGRDVAENQWVLSSVYILVATTGDGDFREEIFYLKITFLSEMAKPTPRVYMRLSLQLRLVTKAVFTQW